jgi:hypothetical protein
MYEQQEQFVVLWKTHCTRNPRIARSNGALFNDGSGKLFLLIQIDHQPDATVFRFIILRFIYSSTCFGRYPGPARQRTARLSPRYEGKTRGCYCNRATDDGRENARNMLSCK